MSPGCGAFNRRIQPEPKERVENDKNLVIHFSSGVHCRQRHSNILMVVGNIAIIRNHFFLSGFATLFELEATLVNLEGTFVQHDNFFAAGLTGAMTLFFEEMMALKREGALEKHAAFCCSGCFC